jgi:hypothetical protein
MEIAIGFFILYILLVGSSTILYQFIIPGEPWLDTLKKYSIIGVFIFAFFYLLFYAFTLINSTH